MIYFIDHVIFLQDRVVYSSSGDNSTLFYFYISVDTGLICVRQPLYGSSQTEYRVNSSNMILTFTKVHVHSTCSNLR